MKILVAIDQSDYAINVMEAALKQAATAPGAKLTVMTVNNVPFANAYMADVPTSLIAAIRNTASQGLERAAAQAKNQGVGVSTVMEESLSPAESIVNFAKKNAYDLIVLGHRGRGAIEGFLIGSVAARVVQHAPCSVLVVR
ncbi:MAG: universal stress protein [Desulfovibrionaceae bacterium]